MSLHTVNPEEVRLWTEHINSLLADDEELRGVIPIDPASEGLFTAVRDGVLLCKLINKLKPGTIAKIDRRSTKFHWATNIGLALAGARALGCTIVNIDPSDIIEGNRYLITGVIWQLLRAHLLGRVSVEKCPAMVTLMRPDETPQQFLALPPEENLIRWVNWHLGNAHAPMRITNFSRDIADSQAYLYLLNQLDPARCSLAPLQEPNPQHRAYYMLQNAAALLPRNLLPSPDAVVTGQEKINLAFVASLFYQHPGLPAAGASAQEAFRAAMQERIAQQERGFKEKLAQEEESLRQRWAAEEKERRRQMQEEEEAQRRRLEEQERALRAEWERRVQRGEEVDQWRSAEEQRIAALRAAQEAKSAELAREMESVAQERKYWAEQHSQLAAQKAQLEQLESAKRAQWEHEEAERRGRWEREEAERRQRWEQEDRARQAAQVPPQQAPGTLLEFGGGPPPTQQPMYPAGYTPESYAAAQAAYMMMYNQYSQQYAQMQQPAVGFPPQPYGYPAYPGYGYWPPMPNVMPPPEPAPPAPAPAPAPVPAPPAPTPHVAMGIAQEVREVPPAAPVPQLKFFQHVRNHLRRNYTLVIDKSGSMAGGRWREAEKAVAHLAPNICRADPDGVDIWFFSSPSSNHPMFENIRTPEQVNALFHQQNTGGTTDLGGVLRQVFSRYFARGGRETILVITDGEPNNHDSVRAAIRDASNRIDRDEDLSLSFIQIGTEPEAYVFLSELDDNLAGSKFDIVDVVTFAQLQGMTFSEFIMKSIHD